MEERGVKIYEDDSDEFTEEYLAWLASTTTYEGRSRVTTDRAGRVIRIEVWTANHYLDLPQAGWMSP
jgi:hypothetical protein